MFKSAKMVNVKISILVLFVTLIFEPCCSRSAMDVEQSVVSVYTTQPSAPGAPLDVYHQLANNIAERITSPIYRFLGIGNRTQEKTTQKPWDNIEILDEPMKSVLKPLDNSITTERDVEELSADALKKIDRKPEKISLLPTYLPVPEKLNDTDIDELDDDDLFQFEDDDEVSKPREGPFIYILELAGSIIQLLWGGFLSLFRPSTKSS